ncbi:MAG: DUF695 domain-containing protein [Chitinophagales bacterium]
MASFFSSLFGRSEQTGGSGAETSVFPVDSFSILQGETEGKSVMGSVNKGYKDYHRKAEFPWCLHIGIALAADNLQSSGLPKDDEIEMAYKQEDELVNKIKNIETAHYIGHLFNEGFLDVYIYLPDPKKVHDYLQSQVNKKGILRGFGYEINKDPDWDSVETFLQ